jgi:hypothetical protein
MTRVERSSNQLLLISGDYDVPVFNEAKVDQQAPHQDRQGPYPVPGDYIGNTKP